VALKVMERLSSDQDLARKQLRFFQNEAALAGKLRHPHSSVSSTPASMTSPAPSAALPGDGTGEGQPLTDHCRPNDLLSPEQIIEIGYKCCKALEFANGLGVVHRDIKPPTS